ncbi:MAG TPA: PKD domain-containing protein [Thermoanaerobaculia bacterium]|nr:PKD domain-containing protein [Thermoanaerobaculia bacterium]
MDRLDHFATTTPRIRNLARAGALLLVLSAVLVPGLARPAAAQVCDHSGCGYIACGGPVTPVPPSFWGNMKPVDPSPLPGERDRSTFNDEGSSPLYFTHNFYRALEIVNGYLFTGGDYQVQVWDIHTNPGSPAQVGTLNYNQFPFFNVRPENKYPGENLAMAPGNDGVAAFVGTGGVGLAIIDTSNKTQPRVAYQNPNENNSALYAANINNTAYAFAPGQISGINAFNMSAAQQLTCTEQTVGTDCLGVYAGLIGTGPYGPLGGADNYLVGSSGNGGFILWDVSNVTSPQLRLSGLKSLNVDGVTMWKDNASGKYYLAARVSSRISTIILPSLYIYDVSCITKNSCGAAGDATAPQVFSGVFNDSAGDAAYTISFSRSGGTPYLYLGSAERCTAPTAQREWLLDVSDPTCPLDQTSTSVDASNPRGCAGKGTFNPSGYWGWYYRANPTGFNYIAPYQGKFDGGSYFYRAAFAVLDVHQHVGATIPTASFNYSPSQIYPGTPVSFTDTSSGLPKLWSWSFSPDGSPAASTVQSPSGVTFAAKGTKTVSLTAKNDQGSNTASQTLTVLDPKPAVGGIGVSPASPLQCQPVTLTAKGVSGAPTLTYGWSALNQASMAQNLGTSPTPNPFIWDTKATAAGAGSYAVTLLLSNGSGSASANVQVNLGSLPALPATFAPVDDPFTSATVQFHVVAAGATEWNWNFGDNPGGGPASDGYSGWTNDPSLGPNPSHTYTAVNTSPGYKVTVKVRNCVSNPAGVTSGALTVPVAVTTPLTALFQAQCSFAPCSFTVGQVVTFNDSSTGATFWDYDWTNTNPGGPGNFTDANHTSPVTSFTYVAQGVYYPVLRVRRGASESAMYVHPLLVIGSAGPPPPPPPSPTIAISGPVSGTPGQSLTYTAVASNCTPAAAWSWSTSGGTIAGSSTASSIAVSWATAGNYNLSATNSGCGSATGFASVAISTGGNPGGSPLQAAFTFSPAAPKAGDTVNFDGSSSTGAPTGYNWYFGDGASGTGTTASHVYAAAGNYTVKLDVSKPGNGTGCMLGTCISEVAQTVTVLANTPPPPPPLNPDFTADNATCTLQFSFTFCTATTGQVVTLHGTAQNATSFSWDFGDQTNGSGAQIDHVWTQPGNYTVTLSVAATGFTSGSVSKNFQIAGPPPPKFQSEVLPWIAQSRGALVQSTDLYLFNPSATPVDVTLTFLKRGTPESNPPSSTQTIAPSATLYAPNVLQGLFNRDNISGFVTVTVKASDPLPVITSFNTVVRTDGGQFGQTIPGLAIKAAATSGATSETANAPDQGAANEAAPASTLQHLIGLVNDNDRLAYFGVSNPTASPASYHLRFFDSTGKQVAESQGDLTLSPFGQRQFQVGDVESLFGISNLSDYRIAVENKSSATLFPYGENLRLGSGDPSFLVAGPTTLSKLYIVGAFSTTGAWQSDVVLANTGDQPATANLTFTRLGVAGQTTPSVALTLAPGETHRLVNAISSEWSLGNVVGVITVSSTSPNGVFPVVQAESYNSTASLANTYGQTMQPFSDADAASPGQSHYLVGLRQDNDHLTTLWVFNPSSSDIASYDLVYRALDGSVLGTVKGVQLAPGRLRQFLPAQHPIPAAGVQGGFTVQVVVNGGKALAAAQVLSVSTGAPAYVRGAAR